MTELAIRSDADLAIPADRADAAVARLAAWAQAASATHQMAKTLVETSFVPQAFRNKPVEATAAMLAGAEVGLNPMASLRAFDVIQGMAAPKALTLRAIVQSHGHAMVTVESTHERCVVKGRRRGEQDWQESEWDIDRARRLKLTGKENWQNQPKAMLLARATAECARLVAADAILGIPYSSEELRDDPGLREEIAPAPVATPVTAEDIVDDGEVVEPRAEDWPETPTPGGAA